MQRQNKSYKEKQNEEINSIIAKEILKQREARACLRLGACPRMQFCPNSSLFPKNNTRNINYMTAFVFLEMPRF